MSRMEVDDDCILVENIQPEVRAALEKSQRDGNPAALTNVMLQTKILSRFNEQGKPVPTRDELYLAPAPSVPTEEELEKDRRKKERNKQSAARHRENRKILEKRLRETNKTLAQKNEQLNGDVARWRQILQELMRVYDYVDRCPFIQGAMSKTNSGSTWSNADSTRSSFGSTRSNAGSMQSSAGFMQSTADTVRSTAGSTRNAVGSMQSNAGSMRSTGRSMQSTACSLRSAAGSTRGTAGSMRGSVGSTWSRAGSLQGAASSLQNTAWSTHSVAGSTWSNTDSKQSTAGPVKSTVGSAWSTAGSMQSTVASTQSTGNCFSALGIRNQSINFSQFSSEVPTAPVNPLLTTAPSTQMSGGRDGKKWFNSFSPDACLAKSVPDFRPAKKPDVSFTGLCAAEMASFKFGQASPNSRTKMTTVHVLPGNNSEKQVFKADVVTSTERRTQRISDKTLDSKDFYGDTKALTQDFHEATKDICGGTKDLCEGTEADTHGVYDDKVQEAFLEVLSLSHSVCSEPSASASRGCSQIDSAMSGDCGMKDSDNFPSSGPFPELSAEDFQLLLNEGARFRDHRPVENETRTEIEATFTDFQNEIITENGFEGCTDTRLQNGTITEIAFEDVEQLKLLGAKVDDLSVDLPVCEPPNASPIAKQADGFGTQDPWLSATQGPSPMDIVDALDVNIRPVCATSFTKPQLPEPAMPASIQAPSTATDYDILGLLSPLNVFTG